MRFGQNSKAKTRRPKLEGQNSKAGDAIAISGLEYQWKTSIEGARSAALLWCPAGAGAGPTIPIAQRRFMVRRFLATARFIGFFFAFALVFTAALAISMPSLFLSHVRISSNSRTLNKFRRLVDREESFKSRIYEFSNDPVAANPQFL
jgi:hypothetical protein